MAGWCLGGVERHAPDPYGWAVLMKAVYPGDAERVDAHPEGGSDVNRQNDPGRSALFIVINTGRSEMVQIRKTAGAVE
jgi:ankyrin repeat protein